MNLQHLKSVYQLAAETPISLGTWRGLLLHRAENGLEHAVVRIGRRPLSRRRARRRVARTSAYSERRLTI
jgi:hypothetical protein